MTDVYIERHFADIAGHESDIEARFADTGLAPESLKAENRRVEEGFCQAGENVALIEDDYARTTEKILKTVCGAN